MLCYYRKYVDDTLVLLNSGEHRKNHQSYNSCHFNVTFTGENEKEKKCRCSMWK